MRLRLIVIVLASLWSSGRAQESDSLDVRFLRFNWENDSFFPATTDRYYTNGLRFAAATLGFHDRWWRRGLFRSFVPCDGEHTGGKCYVLGSGVSLTQTMYTPRSLFPASYIPGDRPYAGWLSVAYEISAATADEEHTLSTSVGVVGPPSLAREVQTKWHCLIDAQRPNGWDNQLPTEPTLNLIYRYQRRVVDLGKDAGGITRVLDLVPRGGAALGNVFTYASAGTTLRFGHHVGNQFVPGAIAPTFILRSLALPQPEAEAAPSGPSRNPKFEFYVFGDMEGRALARNLLLDGSTFRSSHSIDKKAFVLDYTAGFHVRYGAVSISYRLLWRTREFVGQPDISRYAAFALTIMND